jgi:hypothetical protein
MLPPLTGDRFLEAAVAMTVDLFPLPGHWLWPGSLMLAVNAVWVALFRRGSLIMTQDC